MKQSQLQSTSTPSTRPKLNFFDPTAFYDPVVLMREKKHGQKIADRTLFLEHQRYGPPVQIEPPVVHFSQYLSSQTLVAKVAIINNGPTTRRVAIKPPPKHLVIHPLAAELAPGMRLTATVKFTPPSRAPFSASVSVHTQHQRRTGDDDKEGSDQVDRRAMVRITAANNPPRFTLLSSNTLQSEEQRDVDHPLRQYSSQGVDIIKAHLGTYPRGREAYRRVIDLLNEGGRGTMTTEVKGDFKASFATPDKSVRTASRGSTGHVPRSVHNMTGLDKAARSGSGSDSDSGLVLESGKRLRVILEFADTASVGSIILRSTEGSTLILSLSVDIPPSHITVTHVDTQLATPLECALGSVRSQIRVPQSHILKLPQVHVKGTSGVETRVRLSCRGAPVPYSVSVVPWEAGLASGRIDDDDNSYQQQQQLDDGFDTGGIMGDRGGGGAASASASHSHGSKPAPPGWSIDASVGTLTSEPSDIVFRFDPRSRSPGHHRSIAELQADEGVLFRLVFCLYIPPSIVKPRMPLSVKARTSAQRGEGTALCFTQASLDLGIIARGGTEAILTISNPTPAFVPFVLVAVTDGLVVAKISTPDGDSITLSTGGGFGDRAGVSGKSSAPACTLAFPTPPSGRTVTPKVARSLARSSPQLNVPPSLTKMIDFSPRAGLIPPRATQQVSLALLPHKLGVLEATVICFSPNVTPVPLRVFAMVSTPAICADVETLPEGDDTITLTNQGLIVGTATLRRMSGDASVSPSTVAVKGRGSTIVKVRRGQEMSRFEVRSEGKYRTWLNVPPMPPPPPVTAVFGHQLTASPVEVSGKVVKHDVEHLQMDASPFVPSVVPFWLTNPGPSPSRIRVEGSPDVYIGTTEPDGNEVVIPPHSTVKSHLVIRCDRCGHQQSHGRAEESFAAYAKIGSQLLSIRIKTTGLDLSVTCHVLGRKQDLLFGQGMPDISSLREHWERDKDNLLRVVEDVHPHHGTSTDDDDDDDAGRKRHGPPQVGLQYTGGRSVRARRFVRDLRRTSCVCRWALPWVCPSAPLTTTPSCRRRGQGLGCDS
eukprot:gnl/Dysnectes_brevis/7120_a11649_252.p1 GENE.gnl/Dysnectes_brevis/7120_a11649_252~~gnl/Dysnectes_brevis/7120_a11649_252.p1  ORF type:complete len:1141 (-),score=134.47 gnl/Dysnectes_brevis/7120_a11649_252:641-3787(-)